MASPIEANTWVSEVISRYHHPPTQAVVLHTIPVALIPHDIIGIVARFMTEGEVNVADMTITECEECRDEAETSSESSGTSQKSS